MSSASSEAGGLPWLLRSAVTKDDRYECLPTTSDACATGNRCVPKSRKPRIDGKMLGLRLVRIACADDGWSCAGCQWCSRLSNEDESVSAIVTRSWCVWQFVARSGSSNAGCGIDKIFVYLVRIVDELLPKVVISMPTALFIRIRVTVQRQKSSVK